MDTITYRGIAMPSLVADGLRDAEAQTGATSPVVVHGPLLYLLVRALHPRHLIVVGDEAGPATLWLALGVQPTGKLYSLNPDGGLTDAHQEVLRQAGLAEVLPAQEPADVLMDIAILADGLTDEVWNWLQPGLAPEALVVSREPIAANMDEEASWRWLAIEGETRLHLAGRTARPPRYPESPRETFIALLVGLLQPENLALGSNVVFDGTVKPRQTKVNFSGMGGQIGPGDLLLVQPEDLNRFTPLPGAVALVLGIVEEPIRAPYIILPLAEDSLTLIVA